jgi:manganese/zinc/iron transport system permease protein
MSQLTDILLLRAGYASTLVLVGSTLLGIAAGVVGVLALLRQRSLLADALAHATLPGLAAAFITAAALGIDGHALPVLLGGATLAGLLALSAVKLLQASPRITPDAALASVLASFFGAGVVLMTVVQNLDTGGQAGLERFIYGQAAAMQSHDVYIAALCSIVACALCLLLLKELRLVTFDPSFGRAIGRPISILDALVLVLVLAVTVAGLQMVGLIMVVALQIVPAAAARFWTNRLGTMLVISGSIGGLSCAVGAAISASIPKAPTGAVIVLVAGVAFTISMLAAPRRGLLATALRRAGASLRISRAHALRSALERSEETGTPLHSPELLASPHTGGLQRFSLTCAGLLRRGALTDAGIAQARAATRAHRLWEQYLVARALHDPSHADLIADLVEHAATEADVQDLERELALPHAGTLPQSTHPLHAQQTGGST